MKVYYKNVEIVVDEQRSRSYGKPITKKYNLAYVEGSWIFLYYISGAGIIFDKKNVTGKHFHTYKGTKITKVTFEKHFKDAIKKNETAKKERDKESKRLKEEATKDRELKKIKIKKYIIHNNPTWDNEKGNVQQRHTYWRNKARKILGANATTGDGTIVRDMYNKIKKK